jgi:hypothetical protein
MWIADCGISRWEVCHTDLDMIPKSCTLELASWTLSKSTFRNPKLFDPLNINFDEREAEGGDQGTHHHPDQSEDLDSPQDSEK